jgi:hypothetical protein
MPDPLAVVALCVAGGSLFVSALSLGLSSYVAFRDRARLKITSQFFEASEYGPDRIITTMMNIGRRPVILRLVGGSAGKTAWSAQHIDHDDGGKRLGEHERYEHTFTKDDIVHFDPDSGPDDEPLIFETLWVEDSLGVRHPIPKSRQLIERFWKSGHRDDLTAR